MIVKMDGYYSHIECDIESCGERSPPAKVMLESGGLTGLGWFVGTSGAHLGKHRCPKHFDHDAPARGLQERTSEPPVS